MQFIGAQFNDDQNVNFIPVPTLVDAGYDAVHARRGCRDTSTADVLASRDIGRNLQVFFGVQNLFNRVSFVQTNPSTLGSPRLVNGGVRSSVLGKVARIRSVNEASVDRRQSTVDS